VPSGPWVNLDVGIENVSEHLETYNLVNKATDEYGVPSDRSR
jgi:hypothetical protein